MEVRNTTSVRQLDSLSGVMLPPMPLGEWVDVPYDVAMRLWRARIVDVHSVKDMVDAWFKEPDGTHIFWASPFSLGDGYGTAAAAMVLALEAVGLKVHIAWTWFHSLYGVNKRIVQLLSEAHPAPMKVGVCMATPGEFKKLPTPYKIGYTMYEADDPLKNLPEWRHDMRDIDQLFVPSTYCKEVFAPFTPCQIDVVPLVANMDFLAAPGERKPKRDGQPFVFGMHGTLTGRKGPLELIKAFQNAFPSEKDVELHLKTRLGALGYGQEETTPRFSDRRIKVFNENWLLSRLRGWLIKNVDCYVFPSYGEGFGMPPREAMLAGCPIIFSNHTGLADIANPEVNWPLPWKKEENSPLGGAWRAPDWDVLVDTMRYAYQHRDETFQRGLAGAKWFAERNGAQAIGRRFSDLINAVDLSKPTRPVAPLAETINAAPEVSSGHASFYDAILATAPPGSTVVDVGVGGDGILYKWLVEHGYNVTGIVEPKRRVATEKALAECGLPINLIGKPLWDIHELALRPAALVSQGVLQDYPHHQVQAILRSCLVYGDPVLFSVPTVYYPQAFSPNAKLRRRANWEDILRDFEFEMHYYGHGHRYLWARVLRIEPAQGVMAMAPKAHGLMVDGEWHAPMRRLPDGSIGRGDIHVDPSHAT